MPSTRSSLALLVSVFFYVLACAGLRAQQPEPIQAVPTGFAFTGSFDCEGNFRNANVHKAAFTGAIILDGKWLELTEKDVQPSTGYLAEYLIGYDAQQRQLVEFDANNYSAAVYTSEEGWKNKTLVMTSAISGDVTAPYAANRFLYTLTGPDTFTVDWQISKTATLNWVQSDHLSCKRRV